MHSFMYFMQHHWLSVVLITGIVLAAVFVYKYWDHIVIKGSGRK
ncbi:hypothetical protein [Paenibacillus naphthalenovorans]|uniref:Uncharacterized protein n=1 Tax=Paenibacillus naphthalenovorans TaxID=162209 RepID=A0A0U2WG18_9BACL|nr:hypothetical protein IJ22_50670 [Paenibacillus naphthalenovorans]GCL74753.1 hypothetical protein PN4B1_47350 [Paenibacillus naphthalenovorans]SDJ63930.1 hypothetical protein SAMN05421868_13529 [Paenibacillus naphthalenovorans]